MRAQAQGVTHYHAEGTSSLMLQRAVGRSASLLSDVSIRRGPFRSTTRFAAQAAKSAGETVERQRADDERGTQVLTVEVTVLPPGTPATFVGSDAALTVKGAE